MLAQQRMNYILEAVRRSGAVRVADLAPELRVSGMTVRRDLDALAQRGLIDKVHGGATARQDLSLDEPGFEAKSSRQRAEKEAIARSAALLVEPGSAVGLSAGTTTWTMARHLDDVPDLTVVTNSVKVADVLQRRPRPDRTVVLTGGIRTPSDALVGPIAVSTLRSLHLDMVVLGVHGMHETAGFTTPNLLEAETNMAFVASAPSLVVVADHTKWSVVGLSAIAGLDEADTLVTDDRMPAEGLGALRDRVGEVVVAAAADAESQPVS
jgi:DeoR/GlpR family transcriptional regulator of sugar metabolism